jgi:(p)ppGpp synthase/HD superfamily hydrolase
MKEQALQFATLKHKGQTRKDGVTPYIVHPVGVAKIVETYGGDMNQICIAKLHDVVEDCDCTVDEIREAFGDDIADGVAALTNTSKIDAPELNRAARKARDNEKLTKIAARYKLVKLADIYYNVNDLEGFKRGFAFKFLEEKRTQAAVVREGSEQLYQKVIESIDRQELRLGKE